MRKKKNRRPSARVIPKRLIEANVTSKPFLGALPFCPTRNQIQSVLGILEVCLNEPRVLVETDWEYVETRLVEVNISYRSLWELCKKSWLECPKNSQLVLIALKNHGYGGNIVELWNTVRGTAPSKSALRLETNRIRNENQATGGQESVSPSGPPELPVVTNKVNKRQFRRLLMILSRLVEVPTPLTRLSDEEIDNRLNRSGMNAATLRALCDQDWKKSPKYFDCVFEIVKNAGYGGSIDNFRIEIYGCKTMRVLPSDSKSDKVYTKGKRSSTSPKSAIIVRTRWKGRTRKS